VFATMKLLVRITIAAVVLWLAFEFGRPWLARRLDDAGLHRRDSGSGAAAGCIDAVETAVEQFGESMVDQLRPPLDLDRWDETLAAAEGRALRARDQCRCDEASEDERESCLAALGVLDELEAFHRHADDTLRSGQPAIDFARRQQELLEGLERARGRRP
jgi:hypothetical protein